MPMHTCPAVWPKPNERLVAVPPFNMTVKMPVMSAVSIYNVTSLATEQIYGRNSRHGDDVESCGLNTALQCNVDGLPSLSPHSPLQNCPVRIRRNPPSKISQHKFINKCNANLCISCELTLSAYNLRNRR